PRRGAVLITVLVVIVVLLLIAYQYLNLMNAESNASIVSGRLAQSRHLADSGVHYAAFALAFPQTLGLSDSPDSYRVWSGNVYNNPDLFHFRPINGPNGIRGYFSIVTPSDPMDPNNTMGFRYGVEDENGKINLNAIRQLIKQNSSNRTLIETLIKAIPTLNEDQAMAVVNWTEEGGTTDSAEASYYSSLGYQSKGGPFDTTDELLLVMGWTPRQLYGNDKNRNGRLDPDENDGSNQVDLGLQRYFTVYSREMNVDSTGQQRINLSNSNLQELKTQLDAAVGEELANFILLVRASQAAPQAQAIATLQLASAQNLPTGFTYRDNKLQVEIGSISARQDFKNLSLWDLVDTAFAYRPRNPNGQPGLPALISSPLLTSNKETLRTSLNALLDKCSTTGDLEIPARININTCPADVLMAMGINEADTEKLLSYRPTPDMDPSLIPYYKTPAWLVTEAELNPTVVKLFGQFITTYSQVYRFHVVGYYEFRGPQVRLEVVVDANNGRPRILHWRDLTDLGKGYHFSQGRAMNTLFRNSSQVTQ
ncbi:MAG TPA: type II secretion system protein GspK, partial [Gemmatales bacterium]|nr:type II secretion system protein GspK [Gemmatales bacterium]